MKSRTLFIVAVISVAVASLCPRTAMAQSAAEREITELEQKMNAAYAANDLPTYFAYYSKDFTQWLPEGRTDLPQYEKMWTGFIKSGGAVESDEISDMHIQIGPRKKEVADEMFQESDVWFKRDGAWKVVHLHYSPAPKKK